MKTVLVGVYEHFFDRVSFVRVTFDTGRMVNTMLADLIHDARLIFDGHRDGIASDGFWDMMGDALDLSFDATPPDCEIADAPADAIVIDLLDEFVLLGPHALSFAAYTARYSSAVDVETPAFRNVERCGHYGWCWGK